MRSQGACADIAARLSSRCDSLAAEATRLDRQIALLRQIADQLVSVHRDTTRDHVSVEPHNDHQDTKEELAELLSEFVEEEKPDPARIPRLSADEWRGLVQKRATLPRELRGEQLLLGDLDALIQSPVWNPSGRRPSAEEQASITLLLKQYRYYARLSQMERFTKYVQPQIEFLRKAGAYVEYPKGEGPPGVEGVYVSHAEDSDRPGMERIYVFHAMTTRELAHQERVEKERGLETFLEIYYRLNDLH